MGNTSSTEQGEPDPWWGQYQGQNENDGNFEGNIPNGGTNDWQQKRQTLGKTIQHLAEENMKLTIVKQSAEKQVEELQAEMHHMSEELQRLHSDAEKNEQVFEKLHAQIQSGREDRQMMNSELDRVRSGFDAEREAKDQLVIDMMKLKEERRTEMEALKQQLNHEKKLMREATVTYNQEREEKESILKEFEKVKEELKFARRLAFTTVDTSEQQNSDEAAGERVRSPRAKAEMEKFQAEMNTRREVRQRVMQAVSSEIERLKTELNSERLAHQQATEQLEKALLHSGGVRNSKKEEVLALEVEHLQQKSKHDKAKLAHLNQENEKLQTELQNHQQVIVEKNNEVEKLQTQLQGEREQSQYQVDALKEVATISKQMLMIREGQVLQLKDKLVEIEASVANKMHEKLPVNLKTEYETQMENIRSLKCLYEERMKVMLSENEKLVKDSEEKSQLLDREQKKSAEFVQQLEEIKLSLSEKEEENSNLQIKLDDSHDKSLGLAKELSLINNLFTQMLTSNTATDMDLDKLTKLLQENHDLISQITCKEDCAEAAASLPKLLLDLVTQVDSGTSSTSSSPTGEREDEEVPGGYHGTQEGVNGFAVEDIALNLPKVWKVLMELLSHHVTPSFIENQKDCNESCYKSIDTPSGPRLVISVSKTFLRLKDLILEKKSLQKELTRLKQLNGHLESKLNDQEHKLSLVSSELRKTWNVVDRMQTQHQQLHTHEKILRYELHEKRKLLSELKQELEYCREKWERARQKNSESEVEWRKLRKEFAARKKQPIDNLNNSGESGFSEDREDSCEEDKDTGQMDPEHELQSPPICASSPVNLEPSNAHICLNTLDTMASNSSETELMFNNTVLPGATATNVSANECRQGELLSTSQPQLLLNLESTQFSDSQSQHAEHGEECNNNLNLETHITDCSYYEGCSAISLITQLKQQLAFFSRNLNCISTENDAISMHNLQALQSIFSLPPIQIPKFVIDNIDQQNYLYNCSFNFSLGQGETLRSQSPTPDISNNCTVVNSLSNTNNVPCEVKPDTSVAKEANTPSRCHSESNSLEMLNPKQENISSTSHQNLTSTNITQRLNRSAEEIAEARAARLNRLEEQCQQLYNKVTKTTHRSAQLCNRLEELHEQYGTNENSRGSPSDSRIPSPSEMPALRCSSPLNSSTIPQPPPFPETLTAIRLPTCLTNFPNNDMQSISEITTRQDITQEESSCDSSITNTATASKVEIKKE